MGQAEDFLATGLAEQRAALDGGDVSPSDLVDASLARIEATASLSAVTSTRPEAAAAAERIASGGARSPLDGVPILLKDNIVQAGEPATCASRMLEDFVRECAEMGVEPTAW